MLKRIRPRLSYANVVASIALFVVLGGGAYATIDRKIGTKDLRKGAVSTAKLKKQAVKPGKLAPSSVKPPKISDGAVTTSKVSDGAVTVEKLHSGVSERFVPRTDVLYASVDGTGNLLPENSRGATGATQTGTGQYSVTFERDITACAWFPSRSAVGTAIPANGDFLGVGGQAGQPSIVRVRARDHNNNFANRSFSLLVVC